MDTTDQIRNLIIKFLQKETSDEEIKELKAWLREDEVHRKYFDEINDTFQASVTMGRINSEKINTAWKNLAQRIDLNEQLEVKRSISLFKARNLYKLAAAISGIVLIAYLSWHQFASGPHDNNRAIVYQSKKLNTRITLPDSSVVWLNTNSTLEYPSTFGTGSREVDLKGEAFFDVKKGKGDFIVNTEKLSVYVKGTKFNVRAYANESDVKTTLQEGKVELKVRGDWEVYTMKPGDQITFNSARKEVIIHEVDPSDYSAWKEDRLVFDNTPLAEIIQKLENRYRVTITVDEVIANRERLTMTIENETLDEVLEFIQLSSRLKYTRMKNHVTIYE